VICPSHRQSPNRNACEFTGKNSLGGGAREVGLQGLEAEGVLAGVGNVEKPDCELCVSL
jgi:hypothetical protein